MWKSCNFRVTRDYEFGRKPINGIEGGYSSTPVKVNKCSLKHGYDGCDMDDCILIRIFKFVAPVVDDTIV